MASDSVRTKAKVSGSMQADEGLRGLSSLNPDVGDAELWAFKRRRQQQDFLAVSEGKVTQGQLSWFAGGKARKLRLIDSPY